MYSSDSAEKVLWDYKNNISEDFINIAGNEDQSTNGISSLAGATLGSTEVPKESTDEKFSNSTRVERRGWIPFRRPWDKNMFSPERQQETPSSPTTSSIQNSSAGINNNRSNNSLRTSRENIDGTPLLRKQNANARLSMYSLDDSSVDYSVIEANNRMKKARLIRKVSELTEVSGETPRLRVKGWGDPLMDPFEGMLNEYQEEEEEEDDESVHSGSALSVASEPSEIVFQPSGGFNIYKPSPSRKKRGSIPAPGWYRYDTRPSFNLEKAEPADVEMSTSGAGTNSELSYHSSTTPKSSSILELQDDSEGRFPAIFVRSDVQNTLMKDPNQRFGSKIEQQGLIVGTKFSQSGDEHKVELSPLTPAGMMVKNSHKQSRSRPDENEIDLNFDILKLSSKTATLLTNNNKDIDTVGNFSFDSSGNDIEDDLSSQKFSSEDYTIALRNKKDKKEPLPPFMLYMCAVNGERSLSAIPLSSTQFRNPNSKGN
mmetsp:Transcript_41865/g.47572  ORF Transcript_41865/g.47572 Transcript_41865/m.47572 type:complete len:485 (+) Transcript_41865:26-1480(+)